MRGAPGVARHNPNRVGIIPAYAGSTRKDSRACRSRRDHPRVCGEHKPSSSMFLNLPGSSPRMRGALQPRSRQGHPRGIIPAYAGSTCWTASPRTIRWDHPRVCGEHGMDQRQARAQAGSSPRMRGAQAFQDSARLHHGIIPAYAGSTMTCWRSSSFLRDHPRVCGEHTKKSQFRIPQSHN